MGAGQAVEVLQYEFKDGLNASGYSQCKSENLKEVIDFNTLMKR
jgi:hypothetical protein